jgi:hypothetical protein
MLRLKRVNAYPSYWIVQQKGWLFWRTLPFGEFEYPWQAKEWIKEMYGAEALLLLLEPFP